MRQSGGCRAVSEKGRLMSEVARPAQDNDDVGKIVAACMAQLRPLDEWAAFAGYPGGLALAVIDAIWSIGTRY